jgi:NDP-sugar pyrophosphorylase family protein
MALVRLAGGALRAGSLQPENVAARLNVLGAGARIHRTATVEGCVLGRNARVGAGAVVRGCVLGDDAVVEELALVEGSVLGAGARIQRMALCKFSVVEAGAAHAGIVQLGVIGAGAQVKHGATLMDMALGGAAVRVRVGTQLREAPFGLCGVIVGPGAVVGSGVRVAPGRVIPPGVEIVADPDTVLRAVELPAGTQRAQVRAGRAVALDTVVAGPQGGST